MRISMKRNAAASQCEIFAYGEVEDYTIKINTPVISPLSAEFAATPATLNAGEFVQFTDLSTGAPTSWNWTFDGGTPSSSNLQNPLIQYNTPGNYNVTLEVSKPSVANSTLTKNSFIIVNPTTPDTYYIPANISSDDYIRNFSLGSVINNTTSGNGYILYPGPYNVTPGQNYQVSLTPSNSSNRNSWRIWIDLNSDGDFEDLGETLLSANNKRGVYTSVIMIPADATGVTRLRLIIQNGGSPGPCSDNFTGEVEDYTVSFAAAPLSLKQATVNIQSHNERNIRVYPNPVTEKLILNMDFSEKDDYYEVFNLQGEKVNSMIIDSNLTVIDLSKLSSGIYLIKVSYSSGIFQKKFVKL